MSEKPKKRRPVDLSYSDLGVIIHSLDLMVHSMRTASMVSGSEKAHELVNEKAHKISMLSRSLSHQRAAFAED